MAKKSASTILCFAYGSNMLSSRMRAPDRVRSALPRGVGYLTGHRLTFDKVSKKDGSGKCDAEQTGHAEDRVYGVLYSVKESEKPNLDRAEGRGGGYEEKTVDVITATGKKQAVMYYATSKDATLKPYHWYKAYVVAGAVEHGLPFAYVEWLRTFESQQDPDAANRRGEERALAAVSLRRKASRRSKRRASK